ncbi:two-component sensor histidine kinase [Plantactinospora sp. BC1]|uniref:sensor histidine kinase n=1 Tax=Plantactinospora sp. BC1 TaxID=2108470 RepID=UPI000D179263|nr:histidine kinase [Plantactinospora sp. BC1]AVT33592.1 two-component sensor histidine kinase [Plantactinospora sp. BC1]
MTARLRLERGSLSRDIALASASLAGGLLMMALGVYHPLNPGLLDASPGLTVGTLAVTCLAVALRRVATRLGLALGTVAVVVDLLHGPSLGTTLVYTQVLFDSCVYGSARLWRRLLQVNLALTGLAALVGVLLATPAWQGIGLAIPVVLIGVLPVVSGIGVRQYRDQAAAERARAEQTARLAELDRRQAVAAERSRMARELHDVVANHLSAVAIHATAALSVSGLDRAQLDQALRVIRENSVQGLAEMRQMIGLLREPADPGSVPTGAEPAPPSRDPGRPAASDGGGSSASGARSGAGAESTGAPARGGLPGTEPARLGTGDGPVRARLAEVDRLVGQARDAGLPVRFETTGEARPLPVGVDLAAYRIVQESLTNALKHGAGQTILTICHERRSVNLTIVNPLARSGEPRGAGAAAGAGLPGAGAGLIGMRERAALLGGRFEAGPRGANWRVHAELPNADFPGPPAPPTGTPGAGDADGETGRPAAAPTVRP